MTETVTLRRRTAKEKLGFSFEQTASGVVVTKVFPNLPAGQSGRIDVDDELLSVNGTPCATLPETLRLLQAAGAGDVAVEVRHPPHDPTGNKVEVVRRSTPTAKLGVTLGTTASSHVVVDKVFAGFPAAHLVVGDRVLARWRGGSAAARLDWARGRRQRSNRTRRQSNPRQRARGGKYSS